MPFPNHAPGGLILRRALRSSSPDDDSSVAKASAAVFSDALAALVIMAFVPMQGANAFLCCSQICPRCPAVTLLPHAFPHARRTDALQDPIRQSYIRALLKSRQRGLRLSCAVASRVTIPPGCTTSTSDFSAFQASHCTLHAIRRILLPYSNRTNPQSVPAASQPHPSQALEKTRWLSCPASSCRQSRHHPTVSTGPSTGSHSPPQRRRLKH